jgi:transposase
MPPHGFPHEGRFAHRLREIPPGRFPQSPWGACHIPVEKGRLGRPPIYEKREIFNAIQYVTKTGCAWRDIPHDVPPWRRDSRSRLGAKGFGKGSPAPRRFHLPDSIPSHHCGRVLASLAPLSVWTRSPGIPQHFDFSVWSRHIFQILLREAEDIRRICHTQRVRSRERYWMASMRWGERIEGSSARSAMVRATLRMRS